jgi:hypothetical protein
MSNIGPDIQLRRLYNGLSGAFEAERATNEKCGEEAKEDSAGHDRQLALLDNLARKERAAVDDAEQQATMVSRAHAEETVATARAVLADVVALENKVLGELIPGGLEIGPAVRSGEAADVESDTPAAVLASASKAARQSAERIAADIFELELLSIAQANRRKLNTTIVSVGVACAAMLAVTVWLVADRAPSAADAREAANAAIDEDEASVDDGARVEAGDERAGVVGSSNEPHAEITGEVDEPIDTKVAKVSSGGRASELSGAQGRETGTARQKADTVYPGDGPIILGTMDSRMIIDGVLALDPAFEACATEHQEGQGRLVVKFVAATDGTVSSATVKSSTTGNKELDLCIADAFMLGRFAERLIGGSIITSFPLLVSR